MAKPAKKRCAWCGEDPLYVAYHDEEWGVPVRDDRRLFEFLILEGAQAGLAWITILRKREGYRKAYDDFDPAKIARWSDAKIERLLQNPEIVRNRLKVEGARKNARAYLEIVRETGSFSDWLWRFVGGEPIRNRSRSLKEIPAETDEARAMSKALKKRGFTFVGPTICYAFMQAVGMVNDHVVDCFRYDEVSRPGPRPRRRSSGSGAA
ncbi:MAG: DNA-3-methyladenine glycosylase I [Gemmatimonadetes bacterium]|nr:DNA-3-methyladenine glycosylase I [Gemmatimonadota bacterium]